MTDPAASPPLAGEGAGHDLDVVAIGSPLLDVIEMATDDQLAAVASHADRAGRASGPAADLGDLVENLTGYTLASDREEAIFATLVADVRPAHVYRVPLLNSDVHNLIGLAEVADLQYDGDAHAAAMDLSLADGRFAPDVLEVAARRAVDAWAQAIDGDDAILDGIATPAAKRELLYAGDTSGSVRIVVRGPVVNRIRVIHLDAASEPPTMTIEVDLTGRRYVENRDTAAVLSGSRTRKTSFTERWTLSVTGDERQPWRITAVGDPVGLA